MINPIFILRLAKGLNETKVDVSGLVRNIKVSGQDKEENNTYVQTEGQDGLKRLRDIRDLLPKLGHHATSQRVEGLQGLQVN